MILLERNGKDERSNYIGLYRLTNQSYRLVKERRDRNSHFLETNPIIDRLLSSDETFSETADLSLLIPRKRSVDEAIAFLHDQAELMGEISMGRMLSNIHAKFPNLGWFIQNYRGALNFEKQGRCHSTDNLNLLSHVSKVEGFANPATQWTESQEMARGNERILNATRMLVRAYKKN